MLLFIERSILQFILFVLGAQMNILKKMALCKHELYASEFKEWLSQVTGVNLLSMSELTWS